VAALGQGSDVEVLDGATHVESSTEAFDEVLVAVALPRAEVVIDVEDMELGGGYAG
jgi:hypothetical protein